MGRTTSVKEHEREYPSGKVATVRKHNREVPFDPKKFEPLDQKWAQSFIKKRHHETHPDTLNTSRIVFAYPNKLWAENPEKYDVFNLDCDQVPEYNSVPKKALPNQIIKVKGKFYYGTLDGSFKRGFPPSYLK